MKDQLSKEQCALLEEAKAIEQALPPGMGAVVDALVARIADKWTMTVLEVLGEHGEQRFSQLARLIPDISQKMLTQTLKRMERDGLLIRTLHPAVPPRVDYRLTPLGMDLGMAFCAVWLWAARNVGKVEEARQAFDASQASD